MVSTLQVPGLPFHLWSRPEAPGCRLSVSPLQWVADSRLQAFRFHFLQWARDSKFQTYRFSQSAIVQWARLQAPGPRPRRFTCTVVPVSAQQRAGRWRDNRARSIRCRLLISVAQQIALSPARVLQGLRIRCFDRPKKSSVSPLQWARGSRLQTFRFTSTVSQGLQVPGQPCISTVV